jgi:hypothetical protein
LFPNHQADSFTEEILFYTPNSLGPTLDTAFRAGALGKNSLAGTQVALLLKAWPTVCRSESTLGGGHQTLQNKSLCQEASWDRTAA